MEQYIKKSVTCILYYYKTLKKLSAGLYLKAWISNNKIFINTTRILFLPLIKVLKNTSLLNLDLLLNLVISDLPGKSFRFRLCYIFRSSKYNQFIDIIFYTNEILAVPTLCFLYNSALGMEREAWDFYGVFFTGNSNLVRILNDYGFKGYPLRKDFPLIGFDEIFYCETSKKIKLSTVEVSSEYKLYNWYAIWS